MARADLLKQLFKAFRDSDRDSFMEVAHFIVDEERKKHHVILANELRRILDNHVVPTQSRMMDRFHPPPMDHDKRSPLLEIRNPDRFLHDLIIDSTNDDLILSVIREFRQWDVLESNGLRPNHKLLFCGPPGCGKTVTAEAIATELGLPMVYVRFDSVVSSLLGETASNLRRVFDYIGQDTWVVLFDEFDAIGRSRDDVTEHGEIKRVVSSFLQMLDNFDGRSLIIAATNFEQSLDPALWRRFDEVVRFERPTVHQIEKLMQARLRYIANRRVSIKKYASQLEGSTFADVERICLAVLKICALDGKKRFSVNDLATAIRKHKVRRRAMSRSNSGAMPKVDSA